MLKKIKSFWDAIISFFATTKLGHNIKSISVTFTGLFIGILVVNPLINELFKSALPTIKQLTDIWPVLVDAFYRAIWALLLVQLGIYKYSSSQVEVSKSNIIPTKTE